MSINKIFEHPHTLFSKVEKVLASVGPKKFFTSPDEEVKKAREGFAAYFFTLALKKYTKRDWWVAQPNQAERQFPDFDFISFSDKLEDIKLESVELTGIYPNFKTFEEVRRVIEKKQTHYGDDQLKFSLLIFINHQKSEEWTELLREHLKTPHPFVSIWTIHLLFKKGGEEVEKAVAQKIVPLPGIRVEADMDDSEIHEKQPLPPYLIKRKEGGNTYIEFKHDYLSFR